MRTRERDIIFAEDMSQPTDEVLSASGGATYSLLDEMLGRVLEDVKEGRTLRERTLLDLGKLVVRSIRESEQRLPETFSWLFERISNYWHYELDSEANKERAYSYIRLYQTVGILQIACREQERQKKLKEEAQENESLFTLLSLIDGKPGIRQRELEEQPEILSETLREDLEYMERKGYLLGRGTDKNRSYILSVEGTELYDMYELLSVSQKKKIDFWNIPAENTMDKRLVTGRFQSKKMTGSQVENEFEIHGKKRNTYYKRKSDENVKFRRGLYVVKNDEFREEFG